MVLLFVVDYLWTNLDKFCYETVKYSRKIGNATNKWNSLEVLTMTMQPFSDSLCLFGDIFPPHGIQIIETLRMEWIPFNLLICIMVLDLLFKNTMSIKWNKRLNILRFFWNCGYQNLDKICCYLLPGKFLMRRFFPKSKPLKQEQKK